jgi:hypothetical protein
MRRSLRENMEWRYTPLGLGGWGVPFGVRTGDMADITNRGYPPSFDCAPVEGYFVQKGSEEFEFPRSKTRIPFGQLGAGFRAPEFLCWSCAAR